MAKKIRLGGDILKPLKPQKYIFKLNSTYLDMNNYNVHIELDDIARNSEIVISVGHSQLIKWIEELTGTENNYLEAEQVRKEIKYLKGLENTKENKKNIKNKYNELYGLQFESNLVSIQFDKKSHFDQCCKKLIINGTRRGNRTLTTRLGRPVTRLVRICI